MNQPIIHKDHENLFQILVKNTGFHVENSEVELSTNSFDANRENRSYLEHL